MYVIKRQGLRKPILDCITRWNSTLEMIERLLELKQLCSEFVSQFPKFENLSEDNWRRLEDLASALLPARICSKTLQEEQLSLSDFYGCWAECKMKLEKKNNPFTRLLIQKMKEREKDILNNPVLLASVLLDPRFKLLLSEESVKTAKTHLTDLFININFFGEDSDEIREIEENSDNSGISSNGSIDEFDEMLREKERQTNVLRQVLQSATKSSRTNILKKFEIELNLYETQQKRINRQCNLLEFWKQNSHTYPELYNLASVVHAVPATQVSVERLFSGLKFLLSPLRTNINKNVLEEQVFIRSNCIFENNEVKL